MSDEASVLAKQLSKFIKSFNHEQFVQTLSEQGQYQGTNLEFQEVFLQKFFMIPPTTEIRSGICDKLEITLPKDNQTAASLKIGKITLVLQEPEQLRSLFPDPEQAEPAKKINFHNIIKHLHVTIDQLDVHIKFLPRQDDPEKPAWTPELHWNFSNLHIQTVNDKWEPVDLTQAVLVNEQEKISSSFKLAKCGAMSLALLTEDGTNELPFVSNLPVEIQVRTDSNLQDQQPVSVKVEFIVDEIAFSWNQYSWKLLVNFISSLRLCLERPLPQDFKDEENLAIRKKRVAQYMQQMKMSYHLQVRKWSVNFIREQSNEGYAFEGTGLAFSIVPQIGIKDSEGNDIYESRLDFAASTFSLGEIHPNPLIEPRVAKVLSTNESEHDHFFKVSAIHRWVSLTEPKQTLLTVNLNGFQVVLDRDVLTGLYEFLSGSVIDVIKRDHDKIVGADPDEEKLKEHVNKIYEKIKARTAKDYFSWFKQSHLKVEITNLQVIIPKDYFVREDGVQLSLEFRAITERLSYTNEVSWDTSQYIASGLSTLERSDFLEFAKDPNLPASYFRLDLDGFSVDTLEPSNPETRQSILVPTSMKIYGRILKKSENVLQPNLELAIHSSDFNLSVNAEQERYFKLMLPLYRRWFRKLRSELVMTEDAKADFKARLQRSRKLVMIVGNTIVNHFNRGTPEQLVNKAKSEWAKLLEQLFQVFQYSIVFRAAQGHVRAPLHNIDKLLEESVNEQMPDGELHYYDLDVVIENSLTHYVSQFSLGKLEAKNLDHPKSPFRLSLLPIQSSSSGANGKHLVICSTRDRPVDRKPSTTVFVNLQRVQIVAQAKSKLVGQLNHDLKKSLGTVKRFGKKFAKQLVEFTQKSDLQNEKLQADLKQRLQEGVEIAEKALDFLELSWAFQVAECDFVLYDSTSVPGTDRPVGSIKIASFNDDSLSTRLDSLQQQTESAQQSLDETTQKLAVMEQSASAIRARIAGLKAQKDENTRKAAEDLKSVLDQLTEAKITFTFAQAELEDLRRQARR